MPLIKKKNKKAFKHNVKEEVEAGKPVKQAVAIAYSMKRRAPKAHGGMIEKKHEMKDHYDHLADAILKKKDDMEDDHMMADGGLVHEEGEVEHDDGDEKLMVDGHDLSDLDENPNFADALGADLLENEEEHELTEETHIKSDTEHGDPEKDKDKYSKPKLLKRRRK